MTTSQYSDKSILLLYPTLPLLKKTLMTQVLSEGHIVETYVFWFLDPSRALDDLGRVKMVFIVPDGDNAFIQECSGSTVMEAFRHSYHAGYCWMIGEGEKEIYSPYQKSFVPKTPRAGELLFDSLITMSRLEDANGKKMPMLPAKRQALYQAVRRQQGLSDYVYFYGRAKSIMTACYQLQAWHRDISPEDIFFAGMSKSYPAPIKLVNRINCLLIDLQDYKGYTPANQHLQSALDGLSLAVLSLRNSVTDPSKSGEKQWRLRAGSGLLMAMLNLKALHEAFVKGGE